MLTRKERKELVRRQRRLKGKHTLEDYKRVYELKRKEQK